jgi:hypothetical protein
MSLKEAAQWAFIAALFALVAFGCLAWPSLMLYAWLTK